VREGIVSTPRFAASHQVSTVAVMAHTTPQGMFALLASVVVVSASYSGVIAAVRHLARERDTTRATTGLQVNKGPGAFDDFEFLFDAAFCATLAPAAHSAYLAKCEQHCLEPPLLFKCALYLCILMPQAPRSPLYLSAPAVEVLFHISVPVFTFILRKITRLLELRRDGGRRDRRGRRGIRPQIIIATALMYLSTGNSYESTALIMRNGMTKASVMRCVRIFNRAVICKIAPVIISFPKTLAGLERNARYFENRSLIPNIVGAIDGSHIKVAPPKRDEQSYYNRKSFHSVNRVFVSLFATLSESTCHSCVVVCNTGRPSLHPPISEGDAVVRQPRLLHLRGRGLPTPVRFLKLNIDGDCAVAVTRTHCGLLSLPSFRSFSPWLMTGYRTSPTPDHETFNHYGSKARIIIEAAFGKLKGQWRCLTVGLRTRTPQDWKDTVVTCVTLHNLTILYMDQGWDWDAGIVCGTDPGGLEVDPNPVGQNPFDRIRDDNACKPRRDALLALLLTRLA